MRLVLDTILNAKRNISAGVLKCYCLVFSLLATNAAFADLPDAGDIVPDGMDADSPIMLGTNLIRVVIQFMAVIVGAGVTLGAGAQMYKAFSEAKEKNGWEDFFKTAAIGVFLIVGVDALAILAFTYADAFAPLG